MPEQSIVQRQPAGVVLTPEMADELVQFTQEQLDTVRSLIGLGMVEYDRMYSNLKAYVERGGRSPDHQQYVVERAASLLQIHNIAVDTIVRKGIQDTLDNRYVREVEVSRIVEVPQRGWLPRLLGK
jgi:hypothetical protein